MSLPVGLVNRPAPAASHPAVVGGLGRMVLRALLVLLPLLAQAAMLVPGARWNFECARIEREIADTRQERRTLAAERAALLDPTRLRREAKRLGLVPSMPDTDTIVLVPGASKDAP